MSSKSADVPARRTGEFTPSGFGREYEYRAGGDAGAPDDSKLIVARRAGEVFMGIYSFCFSSAEDAWDRHVKDPISSMVSVGATSASMASCSS